MAYANNWVLKVTAGTQHDGQKTLFQLAPTDSSGVDADIQGRQHLAGRVRPFPTEIGGCYKRLRNGCTRDRP